MISFRKRLYREYRVPFSTTRLLIVLSILVFFFGIAPELTHAATIYFESQEEVLGTEGSFFVDVLLDVSEEINAISVAIDVSEQLTPVDTRDSNSIISLWVGKPDWNEEARTLTFSGLIPGGFSGSEARLIAIEFRSTGDTGRAELSFDSAGTFLFENSPNTKFVPLTFENLTLKIQEGKNNISVKIDDLDPPEVFTPLIAQHEDAFEGKYAVIFFSQDKESGMCCYQVVEKRGVEEKDYTKLLWRDAESPYILEDQSLRSFIYVKALDKEGNEQVAILVPQSTWSGYLSSRVTGSIITILAILGIALFCFSSRRRRKQF